MSTALYRRYRPDSFLQLIGQEHVTVPLRAALKVGKVTHAYLFSGPRGCGKTTSARIFARCLNCAQGPTDTPCGECDSCRDLATGGPGSLDVVEIDAASHGGVDDARELRERATFAPVRDRYKIFIIDEAHMVSSQGFNALLKLVEEPPEHVKFVFATTEPDKVLGTIRSRTHHYPFRLVPPDVLEPYLGHLAGEEGIEVAPGVLNLVIRAGGGSVRDTLSVLDQLMAGAVDGVLPYAQAVALLGYTDSALLDESVDALAGGDGAAVYRVVERMIDAGHDPRRFVEDLLQRLRDLLIIAVAGDGAADVLTNVPADQMERMVTQARNWGPSALSRAADLTDQALRSMVGATSPRLQLELLIGRILVPSSALAMNGGHGGMPVHPGAAGAAGASGAGVLGTVASGAGGTGAGVLGAGGAANSGMPAGIGAAAGSGVEASGGGLTGAVGLAGGGAPHENPSVDVPPPGRFGAAQAREQLRRQRASAAGTPDTGATGTGAPAGAPSAGAGVAGTGVAGASGAAPLAGTAGAPSAGVAGSSDAAPSAGVAGSSDAAASDVPATAGVSTSDWPDVAPTPHADRAAFGASAGAAVPGSSSAATAQVPSSTPGAPRSAATATTATATSAQVPSSTSAAPNSSADATLATPQPSRPAHSAEAPFVASHDAHQTDNSQAFNEPQARVQAEDHPAPSPNLTQASNSWQTVPQTPDHQGPTLSSAEADMLRQRWSEVIERLSSISRVAWSMLRENAQLGGVEGSQAVVVLPTQGMVDNFVRANRALDVQRAIYEATGLQLVVTAQVGQARGGASVTTPSAAAAHPQDAPSQTPPNMPAENGVTAEDPFRAANLESHAEPQHPHSVPAPQTSPTNTVEPNTSYTVQQPVAEQATESETEPATTPAPVQSAVPAPPAVPVSSPVPVSSSVPVSSPASEPEPADIAWPEPSLPGGPAPATTETSQTEPNAPAWPDPPIPPTFDDPHAQPASASSPDTTRETVAPDVPAVDPMWSSVPVSAMTWSDAPTPPVTFNVVNGEGAGSPAGNTESSEARSSAAQARAELRAERGAERRADPEPIGNGSTAEHAPSSEAHVSAAEDDTASIDDDDIDISPLVGLEAVQKILGARVIDEHPEESAW